MNEKPTLKVFYNSACPVCDAGIRSQQRKESVCGVEWKDVHLDNEMVQELGAELEFVRERLHVVDERGELQVGYNAFITIWRHSPSEQWKATVSSLPGVKQILCAIYNLFAKVLYKWNRAKDHW